jgi:hypothetical protein
LLKIQIKIFFNKNYNFEKIGPFKDLSKVFINAHRGEEGEGGHLMCPLKRLQKVGS